MDLQTENRLATLLMDEARKLRREADKEGVLAYLRKPKVRGRPNARFLTATVLGVQQANKAVEVDELWRAREKELVLEKRLQRDSKGEASGVSKCPDSRSYSAKREKSGSSLPSREHGSREVDLDEDDGFRDEEIDKFLSSRVKRGRGAVGSRMDEPGPYPVHALRDNEEDAPDIRTHEEWERRSLGPEKPSFLVPQNFIDCSSAKKKAETSSSRKHRKDGKHREEKKWKKRSRKEKRSKHRH